MVELQGEGTVRKTKKKEKAFPSLLLQCKVVLSKSQYLSNMFQNKYRRGGTNIFMSVPVEVLTEIVSRLLPVNLISLSRCNKFFRNLLMNRTSKHMWTSAMKNVEGLPPCPTDMSEPYYATLLFLPDCTICGGNEDCEPYFRLRLRLCVTCRSNHLMTVCLPPRGLDELVFARELDGLVSSVEVFKRSGPVARISGFTVIKEEANDIRSKFEELQEIGDETTLNTWKEERVTAVEERARQAYAMHCFLSHPRSNNPQDAYNFQSGAQVRRYRPYIELHQLSTGQDAG
ncbi:unnamed protein product [Rhizoctonia solani]|uniref:F-box domain-containing protein n=1 Tax=Rhizoctonia solani TaxID=456999 RepID=A0A8H3GGV5_9AGAM|nr:unnamed protein product [Rhizoctonia solani]